MNLDYFGLLLWLLSKCYCFQGGGFEVAVQKLNNFWLVEKVMTNQLMHRLNFLLFVLLAFITFPTNYLELFLINFEGYFEY